MMKTVSVYAEKMMSMEMEIVAVKEDDFVFLYWEIWKNWVIFVAYMEKFSGSGIADLHSQLDESEWFVFEIALRKFEVL